MMILRVVILSPRLSALALEGTYVVPIVHAPAVLMVFMPRLFRHFSDSFNYSVLNHNPWRAGTITSFSINVIVRRQNVECYGRHIAQAAIA